MTLRLSYYKPINNFLQVATAYDYGLSAKYKPLHVEKWTELNVLSNRLFLFEDSESRADVYIENVDYEMNCYGRATISFRERGDEFHMRRRTGKETIPSLRWRWRWLH